MKTPRTDSELREAAAKVPCETCGAPPPEKLDVFRAGLRAVLAGKCPFCAKARMITFTVDEQPPPPAPERLPPPISRAVIAERVLGALITPARPPGTVGELFDALDVPLEASAVVTNGSGTIVRPAGMLERLPGAVPWIAARYAFDGAREAPVATLDALRERRLSFFAIVCLASDEISSALSARFGPPAEIDGAKGDGYLAYGSWVYTQRSKVLGWFERPPDWLRAPADEGRRDALQAFDRAVSCASNVEELRAVASQLPASCGIVPRAERSGAEGIEVAFVPPIPAKVLVDALVWHVVTARPSSDGWRLDRLAGKYDPEPTKPLLIGAWAATPRLEDHPTGGIGSDGFHACQALDVVVSMSVGPIRPGRWGAAAAANAAATLAAMAAQAPAARALDTRQRILDSIARWDAQVTAMVAAGAKPAQLMNTMALKNYTPGARQLVASAQKLADDRKHKTMTPIHVLVCLLALSAVKDLLREAGADADAALLAAESWLGKILLSEEPSFLSADALALLERATQTANGQHVSLIDLVAACVARPGAATLEQLDAQGTTETFEQLSMRTIITAGRLDRFVRRANE